MTDLPVPLAGSTLVVGPSQAGKTRLTARALDRWTAREGTDGVVVLEFAPVVERDGEVLGGRLDRFASVPDDAWHGVLDAHAPRFEGNSDDEALALANDNAERAAAVLDAAESAFGDPRAVFVNDATIPLQGEAVAPARLTDYCGRADCAVLNALESDELGTDDPVSRRERAALSALRAWAERVVELD